MNGWVNDPLVDCLSYADESEGARRKRYREWWAEAKKTMKQDLAAFRLGRLVKMTGTDMELVWSPDLQESLQKKAREVVCLKLARGLFATWLLGSRFGKDERRKSVALRSQMFSDTRLGLGVLFLLLTEVIPGRESEMRERDTKQLWSLITQLCLRVEATDPEEVMEAIIIIEQVEMGNTIFGRDSALGLFAVLEDCLISKGKPQEEVARILAHVRSYYFSRVGEDAFGNREDPGLAVFVDRDDVDERLL